MGAEPLTKNSIAGELNHKPNILFKFLTMYLQISAYIKIARGIVMYRMELCKRKRLVGIFDIKFPRRDRTNPSRAPIVSILEFRFFGGHRF